MQTNFFANPIARDIFTASVYADLAPIAVTVITIAATAIAAHVLSKLF